MKKDKTPIPISYEQIIQKASSALSPYFEIRGEAGNILVCGEHPDSPKCNFKTNDIESAMQAVINDGQNRFVFIRFMANPPERTIAQAYAYSIGETGEEDIVPYWAGKEQGQLGNATPNYNPHYFYQQHQQLLGAKEKNMHEIWQMQMNMQAQQQQAMAGAIKSEIIATTNQQILEVQRQSLQNEFEYKKQALDEAYKAKQDMLDLTIKIKEKELEDRSKRLNRYAQKLRERASELEALDSENKNYYKKIGTGILGSIPEALGSYFGVEAEPMKVAKNPMKGAKKEAEKEQPEPEEVVKERQAKSERAGVRSWQRAKKEATEQPE